ncbi:MAG: tRNA uridine-5-carboxymethylaminomethyl(34) synthesis enzyme MnmG [Bradymonadales bacterium]
MLHYPQKFDVIVLGGGHAACEAAWALAKLQKRVLLLTLGIDSIAQLSCNPSIGGIAKGHLAKEIDAMGGIMARVADASAIQYRTLNASKGPAVQSTRVQCDTALYHQDMLQRLMKCERISIVQAEVEDIVVKGGEFSGVRAIGDVFYAGRALVICAGTFLRGLCHVGAYQFEAGRAGDKASVKFAQSLEALGVEFMRLKTGTPARLDAKTLDWSKFEIQEGDTEFKRFSFYENAPLLPQRPCYIAHTTPQTHDIISAARDRSPMYNGSIHGIGARYCPSIEDKVVRFADKDRHQIFLEPMGLRTQEIYPAGISTSLPFDVQCEFIHSIPGFERAHIIRPGYAVEYDALVSGQITHALALREFPSIFVAGQINATSGYEEAAAQGLMAGINAARYLDNEAPFILRRDQAYIAVMIDDLVLRGVDEPYRMFTSRAEFRLSLREDNADARLSEIAHKLGLLSDSDWERYTKKVEQIGVLNAKLNRYRVADLQDDALSVEEKAAIPSSGRLISILKRPEINMELLKKAQPDLAKFPNDVARSVEIQIKFDGYITREAQRIAAFQAQEARLIPDEFDYTKLNGLSTELLGKFMKYRPRNFAEASRIQGVTPAALNALWIGLRS